MPSSIAKNAQEGTRSEYLAQYILSTFGTAIPVPHPEDSGIDLYGTLGYRVGRRFHVSNHYLIQIKSNNTPILYKGEEEVKWLLSHKNPFFIGIVNKAKGSLEIYQTLSISMLYAKININSITLIPESKKGFDYFSDNHQKKI